MDFKEVFVNAVAALYRAREYNRFLPRLDAFDETERVVLDIPKGTYEVFKSLSEILGVPPNVLLIAFSSAAAATFLEYVRAQEPKSD